MNRNRAGKHGLRLQSWDNRQFARLRIGIGVGLLLVSAILYAAGVSALWYWPLLPVAALHFALAIRLFRIAGVPEQSVNFR
ncbi:MAG: hypothetical protein JO027_07520 [Solirubrobacterales bacterium]|nr:hypothetical protein [Solirubrobacterales bacterium]